MKTAVERVGEMKEGMNVMREREKAEIKNEGMNERIEKSGGMKEVLYRSGALLGHIIYSPLISPPLFSR